MTSVISLLAPDAQDLLFKEARTAQIKNAPTSLNSQPLRAVLIRSDEARARLVQRMAPGNQPKVRQRAYGLKPI
ncbi:hypothetical protein SSOG_01698 [Streptomyces himastatinicus ATCC 53653]|uniref:Uncharacterized protein n=1 Tax=Streptomyces himastatinicus ATCC 53653 TaxID=457427 RepID=D9WR09_9ACTN|nr:hypothetical protein SSOG_01698 [Streptomyces himastatinicus ATCC 53653]